MLKNVKKRQKFKNVTDGRTDGRTEMLARSSHSMAFFGVEGMREGHGGTYRKGWRREWRGKDKNAAVEGEREGGRRMAGNGRRRRRRELAAVDAAASALPPSSRLRAPSVFRIMRSSDRVYVHDERPAAG